MTSAQMNTSVVFTTIHFICNFQMRPVIQSACPWQAFPTKSSITLQLVHDHLQEEYETQQIQPQELSHFLLNLPTCLISQSVCLWQAFQGHSNVTHQVIVPICKLRKKEKVVNTEILQNMTPGALFTTLHFLLYLQIG